MNESTELLGLWKPDHEVRVIRHQDESNAPTILLVKLFVQHAEKDPFRLIQVEQSAAMVHSERHEVDVKLIVKDPAIGHVDISKLKSPSVHRVTPFLNRNAAGEALSYEGDFRCLLPLRGTGLKTGATHTIEVGWVLPTNPAMMCESHSCCDSLFDSMGGAAVPTLRDLHDAI